VYLTLPWGWTVASCPALRPYHFSPTCIPGVTIGYWNHLVVPTNRIRDIGLTLHRSSSSRRYRYDPKTDIVSSTLAEHFPRKWYGASSFSPHTRPSINILACLCQCLRCSLFAHDRTKLHIIHNRFKCASRSNFLKSTTGTMDLEGSVHNSCNSWPLYTCWADQRPCFG